jgi:hypothetical protein
MNNPYGLMLDDASLRWAAAQGVPESVIAAVRLLHERSVDKIVVRLTTAELDQIIKIVGRSPRDYPPGTYAALKEQRQRRSVRSQPHAPLPLKGPLHLPRVSTPALGARDPLIPKGLRGRAPRPGARESVS